MLNVKYKSIATHTRIKQNQLEATAQFTSFCISTTIVGTYGDNQRPNTISES